MHAGEYLLRASSVGHGPLVKKPDALSRGHGIADISPLQIVEGDDDAEEGREKTVFLPFCVV